MFKTVGIYAHVDAGKTSVAESILYLTKQISKQGRVDHQSTIMDNHFLEKTRKITIFSDMARFNYNHSMFTLIDTPGHVDFAHEMEQTISILDAAIIVIDATTGIQSHTRTVFTLLNEAKKPIIFFLNKTDREDSNVEKCIAEIKSLTETIVYYGQFEQSLIEAIALLDDELLDVYDETGYCEETWKLKEKTLFMNQQLTPICAGSALFNDGIIELLELLDRLCVPSYDDSKAPSGVVFCIRHDQLQPITFIKLMQGSIRVKDEIVLHSNQQLKLPQKIHQLRYYTGSTYESISNVVAGEIVALCGVADSEIGDCFGTYSHEFPQKIIPTLKVSVSSEATNSSTLLGYMQQLAKENPTLQVEVDEISRAIHVHVLGVIAIEVLESVLKNRFNCEVRFSSPSIVYKETILNDVIGSGHYEPLKHYAEVHVKMSPGKNGSGITFNSVAKRDDLPISTQNLIKSHVFERPLIGILSGHALTDVVITLLTGRYHEKHTSGGDFREATHRAIRQGLEKSSSIVLEPIYDVFIEVPSEKLGRVMSDLKRCKGTFDTPLMTKTCAKMTARVPVATFIDYPKIFASYTLGQGTLQLSFYGYAPCHNQEEVLETIKYDKTKDRLNPSASIFCAKGSGFVVAWDEVDTYMHCEIKEFE